MTHARKKPLPGCSVPHIKDSHSTVHFCHFHVIAYLLFSLFWSSLNANAQRQAPLELFTPVQGDKLFDATPLQTERLAHIRSLPTTRSIHLVRINKDALSGDA